MFHLTFIYQLWIYLVVVNFILLYLYTNRIYKYWKDRGVVYAEPWFPLGNLGFLMRRSVSSFFCNLNISYPRDYVGVFLGLRPTLILQSPELVRNVLTKDHEYFQDRFLYSGHSDQVGALNLFSLKSPLWKPMRNELTPLFTSKRLKVLAQIMNINAKDLVNKIRRDFIDGSKQVNLKEISAMYVTDVLSYSVFSIRDRALNDEPSPLWQINRHVIKWSFSHGLELISVCLLPAFAAFLRFKFFTKTATEYIIKLFWAVVKEKEQNNNSNYADLLSHLLQLKNDLKLATFATPDITDNLMIAQAAIFILGSVETSSSTLTYFLHELAHNPEKQDKLFAEVKEAIEENETEELTVAQLSEMKYLAACTYETMRKYPAVPYLDRVCVKEYQLNDDLTIEKGVPVLINIAGIHLNENIYPQPETWMPDRFISNTSENENLHHSFLTFGAGPRQCIGRRYGLVQVRLAIAHIIYRYKLEPTEPYVQETDPYSLFLVPIGGGSVKFVAR